MGDPTVVDPTAVLWALLGPVLVTVIAFAASAASAAVEARAAGLPAAVGWGMPSRESARLLRQQRRITLGSDVLLWRIGGAGLVVAAFLMVLVVPIGGTPAADLPLGVVWFNLIDVAVWALWWLLGWGANSVAPLIGGYRFLAQAVAYELPLMFALTTPAVAAGSLRVLDVVDAQQPVWFVLVMPVAFVVYVVSVAGFSAWGPFAAASAPDIAGGVLAELSGADRLVVLAGRWCLLAAGAMFAVPLFLGGGTGPLLPETVWFLLKTGAMLALLIGVGRLVPLVRPQRLAEIGWVIALPLTLLQLLGTSIVAAVVVAGRT